MKIPRLPVLATLVALVINLPGPENADAAEDAEKDAVQQPNIGYHIAKLSETTRKAMNDPQVKAAADAAKAAGYELSRSIAAKMKKLEPAAAALFKKDRKALTAEEQKKLAQLYKRALTDPQVKEACDRCKALSQEAEQKLYAKMKEIDPGAAPIIKILEQRIAKQHRRVDGTGKNALPPAGTEGEGDRAKSTPTP